MPYDRVIWGQDAWDELARDGLGIIVDPIVFRIGQLFLEGAAADPLTADDRWRAIESDIGALFAFFDLVVLHKQLPAFNYGDTFNPPENQGDPLGELVNTGGDKVIVHVDIEHRMYRLAKEAALGELEARVAAGPFITTAMAREIVDATNSIQYEWAPDLEQLKPVIHSTNEERVAQFLLGQLVFAGYAQQTGAPHILAPRRSRLTAAIGLQVTKADQSVESQIFDELRRRSKEAGADWRTDKLPWRPSFLPLLVERAQDRRYKSGPDVILEDAKKVRDSKAVARYRNLHEEVEESGARSREARKELVAAANVIAKSLDASRANIRSFRHMAVEALPSAGGKAIGSLAGGLVAGPPGAALGAASGFVAEHIVLRSQHRLFGWILNGLPMRSARKILSQAVIADFALRKDVTTELRIIWESPRASASTAT